MLLHRTVASFWSVSRFAVPSTSTSRPLRHAIRRNFSLSHVTRGGTDGILTNEHIATRYTVARLVDPETSKLRDPAPLSEILSAMDRKTDFLQLVSEHPEAIVKIVSKKEARDKRVKEKKKEILNKREEKEIQLTWGIASGDLSHKLRKVRQEIEKGNRVDLVYAPKKGQRLPSLEEKEQKVKDTLDLLGDIAKEWKAREQTQRMIVIYLEKKPKS